MHFNSQFSISCSVYISENSISSFLIYCYFHLCNLIKLMSGNFVELDSATWFVCDHRHILMHTFESFFKVYHRMVLCDTLECVESFNMDWQDIRDIRQFYSSLLLQTSMAPKSYFWDRHRRLIHLPCYLRHFRFENSDLTCKVIKTERINSCIYVYI